MAFCLTFNDVDWSLTRDVVTTVGAVVGIIGTIGLLTIGAIGLSTWRRQLKGTTEYELAKGALLASRQVCDAIQAVRNPVLHLRQEEVEQGRSIKEEMRIYDQRMNTVAERWLDLRMIALEAEIVWGKEALMKFDPIKHLIGTLRSSIWLHFWIKGAYAGPGTVVDRSPEHVARNEKIIFFVSENDEFSTQINQAIENVDSYFKKQMRG